MFAGMFFLSSLVCLSEFVMVTSSLHINIWKMSVLHMPCKTDHVFFCFLHKHKSTIKLLYWLYMPPPWLVEWSVTRMPLLLIKWRVRGKKNRNSFLVSPQPAHSQKWKFTMLKLIKSLLINTWVSGWMMDDNLSWTPHIFCLGKRIEQCIYFLRRLQNYVGLSIFYFCNSEVIMLYCSTVWLSNLTVKNKSKLYNQIKVCSKIIGLPAFKPFKRPITTAAGHKHFLCLHTCNAQWISAPAFKRSSVSESIPSIAIGFETPLVISPIYY